jgi:N-acetylmuramoyl-L-alanine amidase
MVFKISLDAGHGGFGVTPGKRAPDGSMYEWDFNNGVVVKIKDLLADYKGIAVLRVDDPTGKTDVPLKTRTNQINAWGSNVHVSVHGNAAGDSWSSAHGIETFAYKNTGTSWNLAKVVQAHLIKETGLTDRGAKTGDLHMCRETKCPAILTENGFMSNKDELILMKSDAYREKIAKAIVEGLAEFFKLEKNPTAAPSKPATKEGWKLENNIWYFYKGGQAVKNNWAKDSKGKWFYLGENGAMVTDKWVLWKNEWYYMGKTGEMSTGLITVAGKKYFLQDNGVLLITNAKGEIQ